MKYAVKTALKTMDAVADLELACDHSAVPDGEAAADRCEVVTDFARLEQLFPEWERLWESDPRAEVFQTPEWARAWWRSFGDQCRLRALVVYAGPEVVGILPLVERDGILQFLGTPEGDYADVICSDHRAVEVLSLALTTLLNTVSGWNECALHHLSKHSRLVRYCQELPRVVRDRVRCQPAGSLQTIVLRNQREEVFKSLLGKHHTRRLQNKLKKAGDLRFRMLASAREIERYLPEFFRHHVRRHVSVGRRSTFADARSCDFLQNAIQELSPAGRVRFGVLELNGQALGWNLGFEVNGKFLLYQHTFDLDAWDYTPGEVLLWNSLEYARDHITREFDFGRGDELYKDRFTNYSRETFSLFVEPRGPGGRVRGWKRSLQNSLLPAMNKVTAVAKSRRSTLTAYRSLRMRMIGTSSCLRLAKENGELLRYGIRLGKQVVGKAVWSSRSADVFALRTSEQKITMPGCESTDVEVCVARLGDLADLSWAHPEILSLNELQQCRRRLKNGDRVYITRRNAEIVSVCWASTGAADDPSTLRLELTPAIPALQVEETWSARQRVTSSAYRALFAVLINEAVARKADLLVHCSAAQPVLRKELKDLGFALKFRVTRRRLFGRDRTSVAAHPENAVPTPPIA